MARIRITIDNYYHEIDSTNPELLGQWIVEIFHRALPFNADTLIRVDVQPSFVPDTDPKNGGMKFDWIGDSRFWETYAVRTPRELVTAMMDTVKRAEAGGRVAGG